MSNSGASSTQLPDHISRAFNAHWPTDTNGQPHETADPTTFVRVFSETCKACRLSAPPAQWFFLSFRNFDVECRGQISKRDVEEILRQYCDALTLQGDSGASGGKGVESGGNGTGFTGTGVTMTGTGIGGTGLTGTGITATGNKIGGGGNNASNVSVPNSAIQHDHRTLSMWIKDVTWQAMQWVDPHDKGTINQNQMKTALTFIFHQLHDLTIPADGWFQAAFQNFDLDGDGLLMYDDLVEIVEQYVDSLETMGIQVRRKGTVAIDGKIHSHSVRGKSSNQPAATKSSLNKKTSGGNTAANQGNTANQGTGNTTATGTGTTNATQAGQTGTGHKSSSGVTLDLLLVQAAKQVLSQVDPRSTHWFNQEQCTKALLMIFQLVPDMGRSPSERWCAAAFRNFDVENCGSIHVESWCEILRQYASQKRGIRPENFDLERILKYQPSAATEGGATSKSFMPHPAPTSSTHQRHTSRSGRKMTTQAAGGTSGGVPVRRRTSNGIHEAVVLSSVVEYPVYQGKLELFNNYEFFEKKGEGAFGKVMVVRHIRTGMMRACKSIVVKSKDQMRLIDTEIALMRKLDHPNILRLFESYHDQDTQVFLIMELCNGSSLFDRILYHERQLKRPMTEAQSSDYTRQILQAVRYIHGMNIVHRDLKPDNVLFVSRKFDSMVKVIDFGLSDFLHKIEASAKTIKLKADQASKLGQGLRQSLGISADPNDAKSLNRRIMAKAGTPHYMAPEMHAKAWYNERSDIFAIGVMTYQMLTGIHPFFVPGTDNAASARQKIIDNKIQYPEQAWSQVSHLGKAFVQQLLEPNPEKRLSAKRALTHQWFISSAKTTNPLRPDVVQGLLKFQEYSKLKQAVLRLLAKEIDELSIKDLREQFETADSSHSGILCFDDILKACEKARIHISPSELEQTLFSLHCHSGSGGIASELNYRDFIAALLEHKVTIERAHLHEIFKRFEDPKEKGYITVNSVKQALGKQIRKQGRTSIHDNGLTDNDMQAIFGSLSADARLDFNHFLKCCYGGEIGDSPPPKKGEKPPKQ